MNESTKQKQSKWLPVLIAGGFILASSLGSYLIGFNDGQSTPKEIAVTEATNISEGGTEPVNFGTFWEAWDRLRAKHVASDETTPQELMEGAIKGLAGSFNDPYTTYFNAEDSKKFADDISGNFGGVGMEIGMRDGNLIVVAPLKNTPAEAAGLEPQDFIIEIDGESTVNTTIDEAVKRIRGEVGTVVTLGIFREGWEKPRDFEITRDTIQVPTLDWEFVGDKLAHIKLYSFNNNSIPLFAQTINEIREGGSRGIILDMRGNPGGFLHVAVAMASQFLPRDTVVVTEKFSSGLENVFRSSGPGTLQNTPVVVLVNGGSASASEILAGALRDQLGTKLVGTKTFGKGTVQELIKLHDDSTLKITIANWVIPSGTVIEGNGLEPDYEIEFVKNGNISEEDIKDTQLDKAIEVLENQLQ